jgi:hypothetical protein
VWVHGGKRVTGKAAPIIGVPEGGLLVRVIGAGTIYLGGPGVTTGGDTGGMPVGAADGIILIQAPPAPHTGVLGRTEDLSTLHGIAVPPDDDAGDGGGGVELRWFGA